MMSLQTKYKWYDFWMIPFIAYFRDLDLDSSFKPNYFHRLWDEVSEFWKDMFIKTQKVRNWDL
jgi:hypothetical protein